MKLKWLYATVVGLVFFGCSGFAVMALSPAPPQGVDSLYFSPDGQYIAATGRGLGPGIRMWNVPKKYHYRTITHGEWRHIKYTGDGRLFQALGERTLQSWDAVSGQAHPPQVIDIDFYSARAVSKDWTRTASFNSYGESTTSKPKYRIKLQEISGKPISSIAYDDGYVYAMDFSPDGQLLAVGGHDYKPTPTGLAGAGYSEYGRLKILDANTGEVLQSWIIGDNAITDLRFSPDGKTIAVALRGQVLLLDSQTGNIKNRFSKPTSYVLYMAFSPDGKTLATSARDVNLWDTESGTLRRTIEVAQQAHIFTLAFSPDSRQIAAGASLSHFDRNKGIPFVHIWNAQTGEKLAEFL